MAEIPLDILKEITKDFSDEQKIGSGAFGNVYKGIYDGEDIAVKLLHPVGVVSDEKQCFLNEIVNVMSIKHRHIVRFVGFCFTEIYKVIEYKGVKQFCASIYKVLCFEYMQGGSLDKYLKACAEGSRDRDWCTHFNIIKGICEGLNFLHVGCGSQILHLDLKPANILLDNNMVPKIADFGLSRAFFGASTQITEKNIGTPKYMPPEYRFEKRISPKYDVFSLGVTIIDVMAGPTTGYDDFCQMDVKEFIGQVITDWRKLITSTTSPFPAEELEQVNTCIEIAIKCVNPERQNRPTVAKILHDLEETETRFPEEWRILMNKSFPIFAKSRLVGGSAGTPCDITQKPWRLESLTISYLGLLDAFSFSYIDQAGKKQTVGPWGVAFKGYNDVKTETINFDPSEFLIEVSGTYGNHFDNDLVMSLTFVTNISTYGPFGNPNHQNVPTSPLNFTADNGSSIVGFHGRSGRFLFAIGVYTCLSNKTTLGAPSCTKTGLVGGSAGTPCDISQKPMRLESVTISYLGLLDAFSFSYIDQAGRKITVGPWGEAFKGYSDVKTKTIDFGPSEFLKEISGTYGCHFEKDLVMSLTFVTNISTYGPFGNPHHQNVPVTPFEFRADKDKSIVGFHGRSGSFLYSIGVYMV